MKKFFSYFVVLAMLFIGASTSLVAQDESSATENTEVVSSQPEESSSSVNEMADAPQGDGLHKQVKQKFIEGGPAFMGLVLLSLILGLALCIERIIYLNLASTNNKKLLGKIEDALEHGGVEAAKEVCRSTRGPVASIFFQGLSRADEGIDMVEKSVVSYGSVQMGLLEKGLTWISLFIAVAPMLGFMGTVIGMIDAFDSIQSQGEISPALVAGGIKIALITTVSGLIVAIILQVFYNYIVSKIDSLVNDMEDSSISLVDILIKYSKN